MEQLLRIFCIQAANKDTRKTWNGISGGKPSELISGIGGLLYASYIRIYPQLLPILSPAGEHGYFPVNFSKRHL